MRITKADSVLCAIMFASLVGAHAMCEDNVLSDLCFHPLLAPPFFFVFPLCQAFRNGIASTHDQMRGTVAGSPWTAFRNVMWPRLCLWLVLWIVYFVVLEVWLETVTGGWNWVVSVSSTGFVLGMIAACFAWAPRCRTLWTLALLTGLTAIPAFILFFCLGALVVGVLGLGDLGIPVYSPWIASGCLLVAAILSWLSAWRHGDAWFRA